MQSITWEAIRGLFKPTFKGQAKNKAFVDDVWKSYTKGKVKIDEARDTISKFAGGIEDPSWARRSGQVPAEGGTATNAGELPERGVARQDGDGRTGRGVRGATASNVQTQDLESAVKSRLIKGQLEAGRRPSVGININDSSQDFTGQILAGEKTIETRDSDSLRPYVGKRVGIVRTGVGKAELVGYATIGEPVIYKNQAQFKADQGKHLVASGSEFDIKKGGVKYGYPISDVEKTGPTPVKSQGIVARQLEAKK
jgi:hypothetical protein